MTSILERAQALQDQMVAWRRDIHQHPELGFQETRTSRLVADTLSQMGIEVQTGVGKTGVVGYIGDGAPVIGIRADMDALPITEATGVEYSSKTPGVMHACGHDAHTAILLAVARMFTEMPDRPAGQIRLIFQPSEEAQDAENKSGGMRMVEEGALDDVDHVIALHVSSGTTSGQVEIREGYAMAAVDSFYATIIGEGCHGAYPHMGVDPVFILGQVINAINGVRARRVNPMRPAVISIGSVHGGDADNVIPNEIRISGTIRSFDQDVREQLWRDLEAAIGVARALGGDYTFEIREGYPATYNDPAVAAKIGEVVTGLFGESKLEPPEAGMGAEDFSYMTQKAPGAMFFLGAKKDDLNRPHHSPIFDIDESHFYVGAAVLAETAVRLLREAGR
jgi:amidohydrolase